jgi:signal transduction histidine kinase
LKQLEYENAKLKLVAVDLTLDKMLRDVLRKNGKAVENRPRVLDVRSTVDGPDTVRISIEDSGMGIPPDRIERILHPFFRKRQAEREGADLCLTIIQRRHGCLWLSLGRTQGCAFQNSLPIDKAVADQ